uniref:Protein C10 n=1 Tax=Culicoides sonorensis TaxID=179676 RepID=A0A336KKA6_CULSO
MSHLATFTPEAAKNCLLDILKIATQPENAKKLSEAKSLAARDMIKMMQYVFPLVMEIEMSVIKNYGFPPNREGLVQFTQIIRDVEDAEINHLRTQIRSIYMPPINLSANNDILI